MEQQADIKETNESDFSKVVTDNDSLHVINNDHIRLKMDSLLLRNNCLWSKEHSLKSHLTEPMSQKIRKYVI